MKTVFFFIPLFIVTLLFTQTEKSAGTDAQTGRDASIIRLGAAPSGTDPSDPLLKNGFLDVTKKPYLADASGKNDCTAAVQKAVNDARDFQYVCFFPSGTYLLSDTVSCEQTLYKLEQAKTADGKTQNYWGDRDRPCILMGSRKNNRPILKINPASAKFKDASSPKPLIWIWAQTRNNTPGTDEPEWGKEQPNISFNQIFQGINIDISGNSGAAGIKHTGSQGCSMEDVKINAEGAFAGMINCPGQGGGTYNIEITGGEYGLWANQEARFPVIAGLVCKGQKKAFIYNAPLVTPLLITGFYFEGSPECAVNLLDSKAGTGLTLIDGIIFFTAPRPVCMALDENIVIENVHFRNVETVVQGEPDGVSADWTLVSTFARTAKSAKAWYNGSASGKTLFVSAKTSAPDWNLIKKKHLWDDMIFPFFEDSDAVNIKTLGARGDNETDDTAVFRDALKKHHKIFVPRGIYLITGTLTLEKNTALFGAARIVSEIRAKENWGTENTPIINTADDKTATTILANLSITHPDSVTGLSILHWKSGPASIVRNIYSTTVNWTPQQPGGVFHYSYLITGSGAGRWYAVNSQEGTYTRHTGNPGYRKLMIKDTNGPIAVYALNTERIIADYQAEIKNAGNVTLYYYKSEAGIIGKKQNTLTPLIKISNADNIAIYNMSGNVTLTSQKSIFTIENSKNIKISCARSFRPSSDYHLITLDGNPVIPGDVSCSFFNK